MACRESWCACGWKDIGMGVRKGTVVSFVPTFFGCFLGIPFLYVFFCLGTGVPRHSVDGVRWYGI